MAREPRLSTFRRDPRLTGRTATTLASSQRLPPASPRPPLDRLSVQLHRLDALEKWSQRILLVLPIARSGSRPGTARRVDEQGAHASRLSATRRSARSRHPRENGPSRRERPQSLFLY